MTEKPLTQTDKQRIKADINLIFLFGLLLVLGFILLVLIGAGIAYLFGVETVPGFGRRALLIIGLLSLPLLAISWTNILKYLDIKRSVKIAFTTTQYKIEETKDGFVLQIHDKVKLKLDLYEKLVPLLSPAAPIHLEISKFSKTLLFISNGEKNLIEQINELS